MSQQKVLEFDTKKLVCETHNECQLIFIDFGETPKLKSRLLCAKCMMGLLDVAERHTSLVLINDFLNDPAKQLIKSTRMCGYLNNGNESKSLEEIEQLLQKFEDFVRKQIELIRNNLSSMKAFMGEIEKEITNKFQLNNIVQQLQQLAKADSYQGTKELVQLEEQLNNISVNLNNTYIGLEDNQAAIINDFLNNFKIIQNECESVSQKSLEHVQNIMPLRMPGILYDDLGQFPQIHQQISQGKHIKYQLLYQGTRDGLNGQSYWDKCDKESHLLTIMTSKNGNRFGGFSPCQINQALNAYVQDPTMKSFLFQYNKKEIYKLKNQTNAVYCNSKYGPTYGAHDIHVAVDFKGGHSFALGHSYDVSGCHIIDYPDHMFGAPTPQLKECKVYKVLF